MARDSAKPRGEGAKSAPAKTDAREKTRTNDPDRTRANIIDVATHEFSEKGLSGARIDEIAERTHTSKRMIYYYFESKEGLYRAVLEDCYRRIRTIESSLDLKAKSPMEALAQRVRFTFDYQIANPDFIRMVMVENIHHGEHIAQLPNLPITNLEAIDSLRDIVARGVAEGVMRADIDPIDLHMSISALCSFNVGNRHTFSTIFKVDMTSPAATAARRDSVTDMILRFVAK
ncbi:MAG: TetR/AcrR family transcriptional regulator [Pseudomonadota bacterium]